MVKSIRLIFSSLLLTIVAFGMKASDVKPMSPDFKMKWELDTVAHAGVVSGTITAPTMATDYQDLASSVKINLKVFRSCYAIGEDNTLVYEQRLVRPGQKFEFVDTGWVNGNYYNYAAYAYIGENESYSTTSYLTPGIQIYFGYGDDGVKYTAAQDSVTGRWSATGSVLIPTQGTIGWDQKNLAELGVSFSAVELYRVVNDSDYLNPVVVLCDSINNPTMGQRYSLTDTLPTVNTDNQYIIKAVTAYGTATDKKTVYVGLDLPANPYPVNAEATMTGVVVTWKAPTEGAHYLPISSEGLTYNVYRYTGYNNDSRTLIAENLTDTVFVDTYADVTEPVEVCYGVTATNEIGTSSVGKSSYSPNMLIGPAYELPFIETNEMPSVFVKFWSFKQDGYTGFSGAAQTSLDYDSDPIKPANDGLGLTYINFNEYWWAKAGYKASMTSYRINGKDAVNPHITFDYYCIPGSAEQLYISITTDGETFTPVDSVKIGEGATEAGWVAAAMPLDVDSEFMVRISTVMTEEDYSMVMFCNFAIKEYPGVAALETVTDNEASTVTVTWEAPSEDVTGYEGFVNGESVGAVTSPWVFNAEIEVEYTFAVKAVYGKVVTPAAEATADIVPDGIAAPVVGEGAVEYFDLQGRSVENPSTGIYIRRQGSSVTKVTVK